MNLADEYSHGGDIERIARRTGIAAERLLDFSANVNPLGLPPRAAARLARDAADPRLIARYPDPEAHELRRALRARLDIAMESMVIGAGADSLIHAAIRALRPRRCVIPVPAFPEYARACRACGCSIRQFPLDAGANFALDHRAALNAGPGDLVILNNPHNPTGALAGRKEMLSRVAAACAAGARVLVDEAFIDYAPGAAITRDAAALPGVVAVRSLTKFYGCPGLRVGYAVASPETARRVAMQLPPWPVSALALNALAEALVDAGYARQTLKQNSRARTALAARLASLGCRVFPSATNFLLIRLPAGFAASQVRERLLQDHAILVRDCDSFAGLDPGRYLRVAVRTADENRRLSEALGHVLGTG